MLSIINTFAVNSTIMSAIPLEIYEERNMRTLSNDIP
jgi:hypothetical protein